jgi:GNAT superfamily N-acetyltransferase
MSKSADSYTIRTTIRPGDLGTIVHLHGVLYAREYGLDATFEPYVMRGLCDFLLPKPEEGDASHPEPGRLWIAETAAGAFAGSIAIVHTHSRKDAQLRWFLIVPEHRGSGLGRALLDAALGYCRNEGLASVFLWTFDALIAARKLYERAGFVETARESHRQWGIALTEVRMDLTL